MKRNLLNKIKNKILKVSSVGVVAKLCIFMHGDSKKIDYKNYDKIYDRIEVKENNNYNIANLKTDYLLNL